MKAQKEKNFVEFVKNKLDSESIKDNELAIIHRYLGDQNVANKLFEKVANINFPSSRFARLSDEGKKDPDLLIGVGKFLLDKGIQFDLAQTDPQKATQLFEWAAENCYQSEDDIAAGLKYRLYDDIAVAFLWRGYSLMNLGNYNEAHELLTQVIPYLNKQKKKGIEMWRKVEYALPKALVPLCEYKLEPTQENLQKAQLGIEDYIKSLRENKHKLEGYLYYFHLKEKFPEVYNAEIAETPAKKTPKKKTIKKLDLPPDESETEGSVIVFDIKGGYLDVFGTNNELEEYVEKVEELGEYPVLASLMELYAMDAEEDPEPIIEECKKLLAIPDADKFVKEKTQILLDAALDAKSEDGTIMLYFDAEV